MIKLLRHVYSPNSEASVSNDGKIPGFCKFPFLSSVIKFDNEMSEVKTKITIAQLLFMQSQSLLSKCNKKMGSPCLFTRQQARKMGYFYCFRVKNSNHLHTELSLGYFKDKILF